MRDLLPETTTRSYYRKAAGNLLPGPDTGNILREPATGTCYRDLLPGLATKTCYRNLLPEPAAGTCRQEGPFAGTGSQDLLPLTWYRDLLLGPTAVTCHWDLLPGADAKTTNRSKLPAPMSGAHCETCDTMDDQGYQTSLSLTAVVFLCRRSCLSILTVYV